MKCIFVLSTISMLLPGLIFSQSLDKDTIEIKELVVTGTRTEIARKNIPLTISVINEKDISQSYESALLPVISDLSPGVFVTERGITGFGVATGSAGSISIRGIGGSPNTQVLMLIDGQPQYMGIMGHPLPDAYVTSDAERVEIVRGPASILYGSNAMGGVINIITKKQKENGLTGSARFMYGSYSTQKYMAKAGYKKDKFHIFASLNHDRTDGHRDSSDFSIVNGYLKTGYSLNSILKLEADINLAKFNAQDPGPVYSVAGERIDILRAKAGISIFNSSDRFEGALKYYYNFGEHDITDGFHSTDHLNGLMFYQSFKLFNGNSITIGTDLKNFGGIAENVLANTGEGIVFGDAVIRELGIYTFMQQSLFEKVNLSGGLRFENNQKYGNVWIPQAGVAWYPVQSTTVKASVAKGFRSPTIRELYLWAPANEELLPEEMMNYEISVNQYFLKRILIIELTGFIANGSNLIRTVLTDDGPKNINTGKFNHQGIEIEGSFRPVQFLTFKTNYSYLHMREPILASPEQQFFIRGILSKGNFELSINLQYIANLFTKPADMQTGQPAKTESYVLLNCGLTYRLSKNISIFITGKNLTDNKYSINYGYPMPGITFFGGIHIDFTSKKNNHTNE